MLPPLPLLSHCALPPPRLASLQPLCPADFAAPPLDDFAVSAADAFAFMHPPTVGVLDPARAIAEAFAAAGPPCPAFLLQNEVHIAALIYLIVVAGLFLPLIRK